MTDDAYDSGPFHDVGKLFPGEASVESVKPDTTVEEALRVMQERRYSQLPVVEAGQVLGVFSLWSLAQQITRSPDVPIPKQLVEDVMTSLPTVTVDDSLHEILSQLEQHEALLVASPQGLQAIVTPSDVLRYFYRVARPFVLLGEIELSLRALIHVCAPGERLRECVDRSLARTNRARTGPTPYELEDMTFDDYRLIIGARENWPLFEGLLGRNRHLVTSRLKRIRDIRNYVFHFRKDISVLDHQDLAATRDWLLDKARRAKRSGEKDTNVR